MGGKCLCCEETFCCAGGEAQKQDGMMVKCGLPCCTMGLFAPKLIISADGKCLCMRQVARFPFEEPVKEPHCGICAFKILPAPMGFMKPPGAGAPSQQSM